MECDAVLGRALDEGCVGVDDSFGLDRKVEGNDRSLDTLCESISEGNHRETFVRFFTSVTLY